MKHKPTKHRLNKDHPHLNPLRKFIRGIGKKETTRLDERLEAEKRKS